MTTIYQEHLINESSKIVSKCRICLHNLNIEESMNLFSKINAAEQFLNKIYLCTQVLLLFKESWPKHICNTCMKEIDIANTFRLKCLNSQTVLTKYTQLIEKENPKKNIDDSFKENLFDDHQESKTNIKVESTKEKILEQPPSNIIKTEKIKLNIATSKYHKCDICNKVLKTSATLEKHKVSMHKNKKHIGKVTGHGPNRLHHCLKCSYTTKHGQSLVYHMRTHTGEKPLKCHCGKQFSQPGSLTTHQKIHSDHTYHTCPVCGKQFKYKQSYKMHQRVHETGSFVCDICNKVLKSKDTLKSHMQRHYKIKNYNCDTCGNTFVTYAELINHKKRHQTSNQFQCNICDYQTNVKKTLIIHLRRHRGERPHSCDLCASSFYTLGDLTRHRRRHTRVQPYTCPFCHQKFRHSNTLNNHVRNLHSLHYMWNDNLDRTTVKVLSSL